MRAIHHTCRGCGVQFIGRARRVFCSDACARRRPGKAWNKGMKGTPGKARTRTRLQCTSCGKSFEKPPSGRSRNRGLFCSNRCYHTRRWALDGKCKQCGKATTTRFCSPACQRTFWNANGGAAHKRRLWERKRELIAELGGACSKCGMSDMRALEINHIDRTKKTRPKNGHYSWGRRFTDWQKNKGNLELLCANCHRIHTWEQMGYGRVNGECVLQASPPKSSGAGLRRAC